MGIAGKYAETSGANTESIVRSRFYAAPAEFDGCFTTFYRAELDVPDGGVVHDHLQPEWANLRFFCGATPTSQIANGAVIEGTDFTATGPSSHPTSFSLGTSRMWGVGILPLGWARFFDVDAASTANLLTDGHSHPAFRKFSGLSRVLCDPGVSEEEQLAFLAEELGKLMRPNRDEDKISRAHQCLLDVSLTTVASFADAAGMSTRTLERICRRYFGFPPKLLMRRQRFMRSLVAFLIHRKSNWTEAMDEHYHDQAQFTREFQQFMLMKPTEYAALEHPILASFMKMRARVWGSPAQTLDAPR
jgi:AraC-like DNA-binding protein